MLLASAVSQNELYICDWLMQHGAMLAHESSKVVLYNDNSALLQKLIDYTPNGLSAFVKLNNLWLESIATGAKRCEPIIARAMLHTASSTDRVKTPNGYCVQLCIAARYGFIDEFENLVLKGADPNESLDAFSLENMPLVWAVHYRQLAICLRLLALGAKIAPISLLANLSDREWFYKNVLDENL
ncbi:MAG: hypothetical protein IPM27_02365 [Nitrosomonadales bacterium]|nr:hypothetical protein [Nitrosomonadales bacterium]